MSWLHIIDETTYRCREAVRFRHASLKSRMLVRCVIDHEIDDHTDAPIIRFCHLYARSQRSRCKLELRSPTPQRIYSQRDYDGPTGLALATSFKPEVVLLDLGIPGLTRYEVAQRLR
jgi:CheY-like chemotaxis protein